MDVTKILEADHREVEALFAKIEGAEGKARTPFIEELAGSLKAHMELEEAVVYPAMRPVTGDESVEEGVTEHELARNDLAQVLRLAPDEPGFGAALEAVKAGISHHVEEEEHDVFPQLRRDGAKELAAMATPFMKKRLELGLPVTAEALDASATKDELAEEAKQAGIQDAGSMTKGDLAEALAEAMAS